MNRFLVIHLGILPWFPFAREAHYQKGSLYVERKNEKEILYAYNLISVT